MEHVKFNLRYYEFQLINNLIMELYQLSGDCADEALHSERQSYGTAKRLAEWRRILWSRK